MDATSQVKPGPTTRASATEPETRASPAAHATRRNSGRTRVVRSSGTGGDHMAGRKGHWPGVITQISPDGNDETSSASPKSVRPRLASNLSILGLGPVTRNTFP